MRRGSVLATPLVAINESCGGEIPNPTIPLFTNWIVFDGVQECAGRHPRNRATSSGRGLGSKLKQGIEWIIGL
jgi:hypothetical protein